MASRAAARPSLPEYSTGDAEMPAIRQPER